ncbi:uncharacterized protein LY89DRAFT_745486, partial [Mollisia scopiformis]
PGGVPSSGGQQIALASYIPPLGDPDAWNRLIAYPVDKVSVLVANVVNGPDTTINKSWQKIIQEASASGKKIIGYVRTGYLGVSWQQDTTRLGSLNLADWASQIEQDVDLWYSLYPGMIGGIFFDEGWNDCGPDNLYANLYANLYQYISDNTKRKYPGAFTVLNPGANMPQCFENSADTLLTFESNYLQYTTAYVPNPWTASDTRKFWHIIHSVAEADVATVAALARERGAGFVHITNGVPDNPYNILPDDAYMQEYNSAVSGGTVQIAAPNPFPGGIPASSAPGSLAVTSFEYTSVALSWVPAANAVGYRVYLDDAMALNLPSSMIAVTVGNLSPGSAHTFAVTAVGGDGSESGKSNSVAQSTNKTPGSGDVLNVTVAPAAASTTYRAEIVVPYAYVRLYIHQGADELDQDCDWVNAPGWPVNFRDDAYVCTHYMVEEDNLYKYTGTIASNTTDAPWTWSKIGAVDVQQSGYFSLGRSRLGPRRWILGTR